MSESRLKNSIRSTASGFINKIICMLFPFITRTIIIKEIGIDYVGLNGLFTSILMVLSISELGFGNAMVYSMYKPIAEKNNAKICALLNLYKKVFRYVGLFILAAGLLIMPFLNFFVNGECPEDINLYVLYLVFLVNTVISYFAFAYKSALLSADQREDINNKVMMYVNIAMYIIQIILLITLKNYMAYIVVLPIATLATNLIRSVIVDKMYPQYSCKGDLDKDELHSIYKNVGALVGHKISGTIILSADNIVISTVLGLTAVACYNNYYYIVNALVGFFAVYFNAIRPSVGNSIVSESPEKNYADFKKITIISAWLAGWCAICMICLFQSFIRIWIGNEFLLPTLTAILLGIYFYTWKMVDTLILYRDAAGMWWSDRFRPYIVSAVNLIGNIILVKFFGLNGVVFTTLFTYLCISYPWVVIILFKEYFKKNLCNYLKLVLGCTMLVIAVGILTYFIVNLIQGETLLDFALKCAICLVLPNIIFMLTFGRRKEIKLLISKMFMRRSKN